MIKQPRCTACGGTDLLFDAWAVFDLHAPGKFELFDVLDKGHYCADCDGPCSVEWAD